MVGMVLRRSCLVSMTVDRSAWQRRHNLLPLSVSASSLPLGGPLCRRWHERHASVWFGPVCVPRSRIAWRCASVESGALTG